MIDYLNRLAGYYLEVLKNIRAVSNIWQVNIYEGRSHQSADLSLLQDCEIVLRETGSVSISRPAQSDSLSEDLSGPGLREGEEGLADLAPEEDTPNIAFQRLRDLYQKHLLNPYEREFLYGYPFVVGQTSSGRRICAPLFTVPCTLEYDLSTGEMRVRLTSDELQFNSYVWAQVVGEKDLEFLERTLLTAGYPSLPLTDHDMGGFLNRLSNAAPVVKSPSMWEWTLDRLAVPPLSVIPETTLNVTPCAAILLVSRPQYYLRRDLAALQVSPDQAEDSVLSRIFNESMQTPSEDPEEEELEPLAEQYLFPFESNPRQREVARAIERHRLVFVEGPPGTGKSQTICNLVCHLVASGKTIVLPEIRTRH